MSFLLMMIPSSDADTPDEDDSEKSIDPETTGVTTLNGTPQNAKVSQLIAYHSYNSDLGLRRETSRVPLNRMKVA